MNNTEIAAAAQLTVEDTELLHLEKVRDKLKAARKVAKDLEKEEKELDAFLVEKVKANATFTGRLRAIIDVEAGRSSPQWKEEYLLHFCAEHGSRRNDLEEAMKMKYPAKISETVVVAIEKK